MRTPKQSGFISNPPNKITDLKTIEEKIFGNNIRILSGVEDLSFSFFHYVKNLDEITSSRQNYIDNINKYLYYGNKEYVKNFTTAGLTTNFLDVSKYGLHELIYIYSDGTQYKILTLDQIKYEIKLERKNTEFEINNTIKLSQRDIGNVKLFLNDLKLFIEDLNKNISNNRFLNINYISDENKLQPNLENLLDLNINLIWYFDRISVFAKSDKYICKPKFALV